MVHCGRQGGGTGGTVGEREGAPGAGAGRRRWVAQVCGRGALHRFAVISAPEPHLNDPSKHSSLKHEKAGTIVTSSAAPCLGRRRCDVGAVPAAPSAVGGEYISR